MNTIRNLPWVARGAKAIVWIATQVSHYAVLGFGLMGGMKAAEWTGKQFSNIKAKIQTRKDEKIAKGAMKATAQPA